MQLIHLNRQSTCAYKAKASFVQSNTAKTIVYRSTDKQTFTVTRIDLQQDQISSVLDFFTQIMDEYWPHFVLTQKHDKSQFKQGPNLMNTSEEFCWILLNFVVLWIRGVCIGVRVKLTFPWKDQSALLPVKQWSEATQLLLTLEKGHIRTARWIQVSWKGFDSIRGPHMETNKQLYTAKVNCEVSVVSSHWKTIWETYRWLYLQGIFSRHYSTTLFQI